MGIAGAFVGYGVYKGVLRMGGSVFVAALMGGMIADWATYAATSLELSFALSGEGSFIPMLSTILVAFMPTQIPLGILEGFISATALKFVTNRRPELVGAVAPGGAQ
jgi:cobalt/nickel transport system permease protein